MRQVSNSEIQTWKDCRRKWNLQYKHRLVKRRENPTGAAAIGTRVHNALEEYYDGRAPIAVMYNFEEKLAADLAEFGEEYYRDLTSEGDLARAIITGYFDWLEETGADQGLTVVAPETVLEYAMPEFQDVAIRGKIDVRVKRDSDGAQMVLDHKGQPLTADVLTPSGWTKMGDLSLGDDVVGSDGLATSVTGIYPLGDKQLYRVTFNDYTSLEVTEDHLWAVSAWGGTPASKVRTTREIAEQIALPAKKMHLWTTVPNVAPVQHPEANLPIDPYVLGAWLGDGSHSGKICTTDDEILQEVQKRVATHEPRFARDVTVFTVIGLRKQLRRLGLDGKRSWEKFVPEMYLTASEQQRRDLLAGLMDTDGTTDPRGRNHFVTTSDSLKEAVIALVQSLGGKGQGKKFKTRSQNGPSRDAWWISLALDTPMFYLPRKRDRFKTVRATRKIVSVVPSRVAPAQCIRVAADNHLYVTEHYLVTHNTVQNFTDPMRGLFLDEQMKMYLLLDRLQGGPERTDGAIYNMLRKTKRSATAKPPFYSRAEARHNDTVLRDFYNRLVAEITDILNAEKADEKFLYPRPTRDCHWKCPFYSVCALMDEDPVRAEERIDELFEVGNPESRYDGKQSS